MSSASRVSFTFSFTSWLTFISLSCLIALPITFSTMLNRNSPSGHPSVAPDLRGKRSLFPVKYDAGDGFSTGALHHVWEGPFIYSLLSVVCLFVFKS